MFRRLTFGLLLLAAAAAAACSTNTTTPSSGGQPGVGPNFGPNTIYVADTTGDALDIFTPAPGPSSTPSYTIAGSNTGLNGPQYMAWDSAKKLYVTNFDSAARTGAVLVFQTFATGNVITFSTIPLASNSIPRGIAFLPNGDFAFAVTAPGQLIANSVAVYGNTNTVAFTLAGSNTQLNAPTGVAADASNNIYVSNTAGGSVTVYPLPTSSPTPTGSPSPTPSPTPTPTVSPGVTASPSPSPTPVTYNQAPTLKFTSGLRAPTGIALDTKGDLYVADQGGSGVAPSIVFYNAPLTSGMASSGRILSPVFVEPRDVKVDSSGRIYVVDSGSGPTMSKLFIFAPGTSGTATPTTTVPLPGGTFVGLGLSP